MKPNRLKVAITGVERFIYEFLDRNPMSTLGLVATRGGSAFVIADPMSNPVELGTGIFFFFFWKEKMEKKVNSHERKINIDKLCTFLRLPTKLYAVSLTASMRRLPSPSLRYRSSMPNVMRYPGFSAIFFSRSPTTRFCWALSSTFEDDEEGKSEKNQAIGAESALDSVSGSLFGSKGKKEKKRKKKWKLCNQDKERSR